MAAINILVMATPQKQEYMFKGGPPFQAKAHPATLLLFLLLLPPLIIVIPASAYNVKNASLKKYAVLSLPVPNPVDITRLPIGKTFQIKHERFILQFFINQKDIMGVIVKRDMKYPIHLRWCFFRSCEENSLDYISVISQPNQPPVEDEFFWVRFPPQIKYSFQGLEFSSGR